MALVQTGRRAGQGSVPEGSGSLRAFGGSARECQGSGLCFQGLATAVEGGQTRQAGHMGPRGSRRVGRRRTAEASDAPVSGNLGHLGAFMGAVGCLSSASEDPGSPHRNDTASLLYCSNQCYLAIHHYISFCFLYISLFISVGNLVSCRLIMTRKLTENLLQAKGVR